MLGEDERFEACEHGRVDTAARFDEFLRAGRSRAR